MGRLKLVSRDTKICAMCKYWNNGRGCASLRPSAGGRNFELDLNETQKCYKTGFVKSAWNMCHDFEKNY